MKITRNFSTGWQRIQVLARLSKEAAEYARFAWRLVRAVNAGVPASLMYRLI